MKKTIGTVLICGLIMTACGGTPKSGLPSNKFLGNLPVLYADFNLANEKDKEKLNELYQKVQSTQNAEYQKLDQKVYLAKIEREEKLKKDVQVEWAKLDGKKIPFTVSDGFKALNLQVNDLYIDGKNQRLVAKIVATKEIAVDRKNLNMYGSLQYNVLAKDGSVQLSGCYFSYALRPSDHPLLFQPRTYKQGESLYWSGDDTIIDEPITSITASAFIDFASIEFISRSEIKEN